MNLRLVTGAAHEGWGRGRGWG